MDSRGASGSSGNKEGQGSKSRDECEDELGDPLDNSKMKFSDAIRQSRGKPAQSHERDKMIRLDHGSSLSEEDIQLNARGKRQEMAAHNPHRILESSVLLSSDL